jgi:hypothetical protein
MKRKVHFGLFGLSLLCAAGLLAGCSSIILFDPKGPIGDAERVVILVAIGLMLMAGASQGCLPRLRRHYPGAQFRPHSQYSSEYRTAHAGYTQKAGRLINLIDSGVGWNIHHIAIPYYLYKRR